MKSEELALRIRRDVVEMAHISQGSHIGSALSVADIIAVLYTNFLDIKSIENKLDDRGRFILSKGHAGSAVYSVLAELGLIPLDELKTHYSNGSRLSGHVSHKGVPGVEFSTGSLGHGVCVATGIALSYKKKKKEHKIYTVIGDGECNEGSVWEMAMFAQHFGLDNLYVIIDHNKQQGLGFCKEQMDLIILADKWRAFGWNVTEIDGHNHLQLKEALTSFQEQKPNCIIAHTIKGRGVSYMENKLLWHYRSPNAEEYNIAMSDLEEYK